MFVIYYVVQSKNPQYIYKKLQHKNKSIVKLKLQLKIKIKRNV